jgi:hypothetical protein
MSAHAQSRVFRAVALVFFAAGVAIGIAPASGEIFRIGPQTWFLWAVALVAYLFARAPRPHASRPPTHGALARQRGVRQVT